MPYMVKYFHWGAHMAIAEFMDVERPRPRDIEELFQADLWELGMAADKLKRALHGDTATFITNMVFNYTNICVVECTFCAFYRRKGDPDAYVYDLDTAVKRILEVDAVYGIRQVLVQGGIYPEIGIEYFEGLFSELKRRAPHIAIHALSPLEVDYLSRKERMSYREVLDRLRSAGMDSMPGGGGEILVDRVRREIAPKKIRTDVWLRVMEEAHALGIPTSATMMYGHVETVAERAEHMYRILELQEQTGGFTAFIAWNFEPGRSELSGRVPHPHTSASLLRTVAIARLVFRDKIPNIQAGWLTNGLEAAQLALFFGANDFGGTLYDERVIPATGMKMPILLREDIARILASLGLRPAERDNWYRIVRFWDNI